MFGILEAAVVPQPDVFNTYEDLFANLNERMRKQGYKIVKSRSQRSRLGGAGVPGNEIVRCDLVCDRGGRPYKSVATKHKTSTKKTGCPWRAKAVRRKLINGWTLNITCDQHNHEPGTPEDSTPNSPALDASGIDNSDIDIEPERELDPEHDLNLDLPRADTDGAALQIAGVSDMAMQLSGDTFQQFKDEYRKMPEHERFQTLASLQLRIAALYAVESEDRQAARQQNEHNTDAHALISSRHLNGNSARIDSRKRSRQLDVDVGDDTDAQVQQLSHIGPDDGDSLGDPLMSTAFSLDQTQPPNSIPDLGLTQFHQYVASPKRSRGRAGLSVPR